MRVYRVIIYRAECSRQSYAEVMSNPSSRVAKERSRRIDNEIWHLPSTHGAIEAMSDYALVDAR